MGKIGIAIIGSSRIGDSITILNQNGASIAMSEDNRTYCFKITDSGDNEIGDNGEIVRDYSIASRCRFLIKCKLGEWWAGATTGSKLSTLRYFKDAEVKVQSYIEEALKPLMDEGSVISVELGEFEKDYDKQAFQTEVIVNVPNDEAVELGFFNVGQF